MTRLLKSPIITAKKDRSDDTTPGFIGVDASVLVSWLVPTNVFHPTVKTWIEEQWAEGVMFLSPASLLHEVGRAISRRTGKPQLATNAINRLTRLLGLKLVEMDQNLVQEAARLAAELGLRGAGSFYVAVAVRLNLPLVTLDTDQESKGSPVIVIDSFARTGA